MASWKRWCWPAAAVVGSLVAIAAATVVIIDLRATTPADAGLSLATPLTDRTAGPSQTTTAANPTPTATVGSATPTRTETSTTVAAAAGPARFSTRAKGAALPSGTQCATWVGARAYPESKGANRTANQTTGHGIGSGFFNGGDPRANSRIAPRVDGKSTGTTGQILRWAACKWGIDEDIVMAQAAIESWWQQGTLGDWTTDSSRCAPGRGLGADGKPGQCPESFGIMQNRYPYEQSAWPGIANSTAMNADLAYAIWRTCFEGYETWLNTVERGRDYTAGDAWGCIGRWFSGRWHTSAGEGYVDRVRGYLDQRIWRTPDFQQP
jgi:hypothetical protein